MILLTHLPEMGNIKLDMVSNPKYDIFGSTPNSAMIALGDYTMARNFEIVQRAADGKFVTWAEIDDPEVDRDWYLKNSLPVPQRWVAVQVSHTKDAAVRATRQFKQ